MNKGGACCACGRGLVNSACGHKNVNICLAELQAWPVASWQGQQRRDILQFVYETAVLPRQLYLQHSTNQADD